MDTSLPVIVTIETDEGIKHVELDAGQVRLFTPEHGDKWRAALFLAMADLWFKADN